MLFGKENVLHILEKALTDALNECGVTGYSREDIHIVMDTLSDLLSARTITTSLSQSADSSSSAAEAIL